MPRPARRPIRGMIAATPRNSGSSPWPRLPGSNGVTSSAAVGAAAPSSRSMMSLPFPPQIDEGSSIQVYSPCRRCGIRDLPDDDSDAVSASLRWPRARRAPQLVTFLPIAPRSRQVVRVTPTPLRGSHPGRAGRCATLLWARRRPGRLERKTDEPPGRVRGIRAATRPTRRACTPSRTRRATPSTRCSTTRAAAAVRGRPARQAVAAARPRAARRPVDHGRASARARAIGCSRTCSPPRACRPTTPATSRSSRPRPTKAALAFDVVVSASAIYAGSWMEGSGAVFAENEVLHWLAGEFGLPAGAGGVFVQGGTIGNLSALVAARDVARRAQSRGRRRRPRALGRRLQRRGALVDRVRRAVMDVDVVTARARRRRAPARRRGRARARRARRRRVRRRRDRRHDELRDRRRHRLDRRRDRRAATSGCTSTAPTGSRRCSSSGCARRSRASSDADSVIVDPHKWLFAPFDACALIYRDPAGALAAHTQKAEYLDTLTESADWNPSDLAIQLTRRARGLPLWFSLATHGTEHYRAAVDSGITARPADRRRDHGTRRAVARARSAAVGRRVPPRRLDARRLPGVVGPAARGAGGLRRAQLARRARPCCASRSSARSRPSRR